MPPAPASLKHIDNNLENVDYDGQGEFLQVEGDPALGARTLTIENGTGDIIDERYDSLPTSYIIRRGGAVPGKLALTFDDGPDPEWTPAILKILKDKHVPATFFMIGSNMEAHPGLVQRVLADGHEVGNHTYTHPNLAETPPTADAAGAERHPAAVPGADRPIAAAVSLALSQRFQSLRRRRDRAHQAGPGAGLYRGRPPIWTRWTGSCCRSTRCRRRSSRR